MIPIVAFIAGLYYAEQVIRANVSKTEFEKHLTRTDAFLTKEVADKKYVAKENTSASLRYEFTYKELSIYKWNEPFRPGGYPLAFAYGHGLSSSSKITLLTHTFDKDDVIDDLYLDYKMVVTMKNGKKKEVMLASILNIKPLKVGDTYVLNKTFTIGELFKDYAKIQYIAVKVKRRNHATYRNESVLDLAIEY